MTKRTDLSIRISKIRAMFCDDDNREFANKLRISEQLASSICTGNKPAGDGTLNKILKAFPNVSKVWLFLGEGDMLRSDVIDNTSITNTVIGNRVGGDIVQGKEIHTEQNQSGLDRMIALLENKDRQIDRLISLLEEKYQYRESK